MCNDQLIKASINKNLSELMWADSYRNTLVKLNETGLNFSKLEFIGVSQESLLHSVLIKLSKILDTHRDAASYWFIFDERKIQINEIMSKVDLNFDIIHTMSSKFRMIRNKVLVHFDKRSLYNVEDIYRNVNIFPHQINELIDVLYHILSELYTIEFGSEHPYIKYHAEDVVKICTLIKENDLLEYE